MRIVLDLQACQTSQSRNRGMGRYSMALAQAVARLRGPHDVWISLNGNFAESIPTVCRAFETLLPRERITVYQVPAGVHAADPATAWRRGAAEAIRQQFLAGLEPDVVHISSLFEGLTDDAVTSTGSADFFSSLTLYDVIPLVWESRYLEDARTRAWYMRKLQHLKNSELLLAISEYSRKEAIERLHLPEHCVVNVSTAVDATFGPRAIPPVRESELRGRHGLARPFVMYTGGIDFRKNIEGLIEAYAQLPIELRARHQLAVVCLVDEHQRRQLLRHADKCGLNGDELVLTGFVSDEDLIALYNLCHLFVFPSLHEGFGLPALEAMACGAPVIGSNTSSIPEVIGRADALFDPSRPAAIAEAMARVLDDDNHRRALRDHALQQAQRFSWEQSARRAIAAFEMLHERNSPAARVPATANVSRPRLAYVSPLPPEKSGIATYSTELLPELARHYEVDLVVNQDTVDHPWLAANFPARDVSWFKQNAHRFDRILYHFGNSVFHQHMFELLEQYPGVVVLHDFFLSGIMHWSGVSGAAPGSFRQALYRAHGYTALLTCEAGGLEAAIQAYPVSKAVVDAAVGVIVHSRFSLEAAQRWYSPQLTKNWRVIAHLRALPTEATRRHRQELGFSDQEFLICSFGIGAPVKLNHRLLDAFLASRLAEDPRCRLVFVGECIDADYGKRLRERLATSPARERIRMTGFVSADTYQAYLASADAAVQLRSYSRGETSGSALDALAHGVPLIVNACGPMAEFPDECVIKLREDFTDAELVQALEQVFADRALRERMASAGRRHIREHHHPAQIAEQYREAIEALSSASDRARYLRLVARIAQACDAIEPSDADLAAAAVCIAANSRPTRRPQLLLDVSGLDVAKLPDETRDLLDRLLRDERFPSRVEPVYWDGERYRYAIGFACRFLALPGIGLGDEIVDAAVGDLLLVVGTLVEPKEKSHLARLAAAGVDIHFAADGLPADYTSPRIEATLEPEG